MIFVFCTMKLFGIDCVYEYGVLWFVDTNILLIPIPPPPLNYHDLSSDEEDSAIILASQLHKNRGTCCTAEWASCLFALLCCRLFNISLSNRMCTCQK